MASLSISLISGNTYQWTISGLSLPFKTTNYLEAGITDASFSNNTANLTGSKTSSTSATSTGTSTSVSGTFTITANGTYTFYGFTRATNYYYYTAGSYTITHVDPTQRPSSFNWYFAKVSGEDFNVSAIEWTYFQDKINEFRIYKGLAAYGFTSVYTGMDFYAFIFRQCANAIYEISSTLGVSSDCRNVQTDDDIKAWYFTNLATALNNVT
ncbi:MAG: hypothetical protein K0R15_620 [Clostridiales bacterium]|jgi:hypothetical protein|nr:hypothetical protein [Clostridiales bacterium]